MSYIQRSPYMGFAIAAAAPVAAATGPLAPLVLGLATVASALPFVSNIGAGRKEADAIGPYQSALRTDLSQVDAILGSQTLSATDLQNLRYQLQGIWDTYLEFIYSDRFTSDGDTRASDGSLATMQPEVQSRLDKINALINAILGKPKPPQVIQGSGPPSLEFRTTSDISLPQAGFLQPGSVEPPPTAYAAPVPGAIDGSLLLKLAIAGGVALIISQR